MSTYLSQSNSGYLGTFSTGSPPTALVEVKSIKTAGWSVSVLDVTHLQSPNAFEEMRPGLLKPGTIDVSGNFIGDATQLAISTTAEAQSVINFAITCKVQNNAKTYTAIGQGFWTKYEVGPLEPNKPVEFSGQFQVTGPITEAAA